MVNFREAIHKLKFIRKNHNIVLKAYFKFGFIFVFHPRAGLKEQSNQLETAPGKLCVAAMPFISERRLYRSVDLCTKNDISLLTFIRGFNQSHQPSLAFYSLIKKVNYTQRGDKLLPFKTFF